MRYILLGSYQSSFVGIASNSGFGKSATYSLYSVRDMVLRKFPLAALSVTLVSSDISRFWEEVLGGCGN
jgi:hypothetical protein